MLITKSKKMFQMQVTQFRTTGWLLSPPDSSPHTCSLTPEPPSRIQRIPKPRGTRAHHIRQGETESPANCFPRENTRPPLTGGAMDTPYTDNNW